jgi:hypothetical protein
MTTIAIASYSPKGVAHVPTFINSMAEMVQTFGDCDATRVIGKILSETDHSVVFSRALYDRHSTASANIGRPGIMVAASSSGSWGNELEVTVAMASGGIRTLYVNQLRDGIRNLLESSVLAPENMDCYGDNPGALRFEGDICSLPCGTYKLGGGFDGSYEAGSIVRAFATFDNIKRPLILLDYENEDAALRAVLLQTTQRLDIERRLWIATGSCNLMPSANALATASLVYLPLHADLYA